MDDGWKKIVDACNLDLSKPINYVDMSLIQKYGGKDVRLLISMESEERLPRVFKESGVFVVPVSTKRVAIIHGKGFHHVEEISEVETHKTSFSFPSSVMHSEGESKYIDYAYSCGLISRFTGRSNLHLGFHGKRRTSFTFRVDGHGTLNVEQAQIEVDTSFEDDKELILLEGKSKVPRSFNIRQLYYPFKTFQRELDRKNIRNIFFAYDRRDMTYCLWQYRFKDPEDYEQIELVKSVKFRIESTRPEAALREFEVSPVTMGAIQANDIFKLMELPFLIHDGVDDAKRVAEHFQFDVRQSSYYRQGMERLGFVTERGPRYALTSVGEDFTRMPVEERTKFFLRKLFEYPPVNEIIRRLLSGQSVSNADLNQIVSEIDSGIAKSTIPRRASTLRRWFRWIADNTGYCEVNENGISPIRPSDTLRPYV